MNAAVAPLVHAFLFKEKYPDFDVDAVYRAVIRQAIRLSPQPTFEIRVGSLLPHTLAYRSSGIVPGTSDRFRSYGTPLTADKDLYATLVTDLADSCCALWHELNATELTLAIGKGGVFSVTTVGLSEAAAASMCDALRAIRLFAGACEVDCGNPWLRLMTLEYLVPFGRFACGKLSMVEDDSGFGAFTSWADDTEIAFDTAIPALEIAIPQIPDSARGSISRTMLQTRAAATEGQRVVQALLENAPGDIPHFVLTASNDGIPTADIRKFVEYTLNDKHLKGKDKARLFRNRLGITQIHSAYLAEQLTMGLRHADVQTASVTKYGAQYGAAIPVRGVNGRVMLVHTAWIIRPDGPPSLVTAYPLDSREPTPDEAAFATEVTFIDESDSELRWPALHAIAHKAGLAAVQRTVPTPVAIGDANSDQISEVCADGLCGYGFIEITEKRSSFARWLRKRNLMSGGRHKWIHYSHQSNSYDRARAYCEAFARVLRMNNVECLVKCRLD
jgi:hypothetical protein